MEYISWSTLVTKRSCHPSWLKSAESTPIPERSVTIVVKKPTAHSRVDGGYAVGSLARLEVLTVLVLRFAGVAKTAYKEVEPAVIIVIKPDRTRSPTVRRHTGPLCDIREGAIAVVVVQNAALILGHIQIGPAITVVIANSYAHSIPTSGDAGLLGHVRESSVAIVLVQGVAQRRLRIVEVTLAAVHQVDVHPAIVVVVQERTARSGGFRQVVICRATVDMLPGDSAFCGRDFLK